MTSHSKRAAMAEDAACKEALRQRILAAIAAMIAPMEMAELWSCVKRLENIPPTPQRYPKHGTRRPDRSEEELEADRSRLAATVEDLPEQRRTSFDDMRPPVIRAFLASPSGEEARLCYEDD